MAGRGKSRTLPSEREHPAISLPRVRPWDAEADRRRRLLRRPHPMERGTGRLYRDRTARRIKQTFTTRTDPWPVPAPCCMMIYRSVPKREPLPQDLLWEKAVGAAEQHPRQSAGESQAANLRRHVRRTLGLWSILRREIQTSRDKQRLRDRSQCPSPRTIYIRRLAKLPKRRRPRRRHDLPQPLPPGIRWNIRLLS